MYLLVYYVPISLLCTHYFIMYLLVYYVPISLLCTH